MGGWGGGGGGEIKPFLEIAEHSESIKSKEEAIRYGRILKVWTVTGRTLPYVTLNDAEFLRQVHQHDCRHHK